MKFLNQRKEERTNMKKTGALILAAAIGLGFSSNVHIPVAIAAESTTTILPINLAVDGTVTAKWVT